MPIGSSRLIRVRPRRENTHEPEKEEGSSRPSASCTQKARPSSFILDREHRPLANGEPQRRREALVRTVYMLVAEAGGAIGIMSLKRIDDRFVLHALATNRLLRVSAPGDLRQALEFPHQA